MSPTSYQAAPPRITVLIERGEGCPIQGRPSRMFLLCYFFRDYFLDDFWTTEPLRGRRRRAGRRRGGGVLGDQAADARDGGLDVLLAGGTQLFVGLLEGGVAGARGALVADGQQGLGDVAGARVHR